MRMTNCCREILHRLNLGTLGSLMLMSGCSTDFFAAINFSVTDETDVTPKSTQSHVISDFLKKKLHKCSCKRLCALGVFRRVA